MPNSWYVYVLFFYYIVFAVSGRFFNEPIKIVYMLFGATLALILFISIVNLGDWWWKSSFAFNVGTLLPLFVEKKREDRINIIKEQNIMFFVFSIVIVSMIPNIFDLSYYKVRSFLMAVLTTALPFYLYIAFKRISFSGNKVLNFLGSISYEIYLIHGAILIIVRNIFPETKSIVCVIAIYLVTIAFSIPISNFSKWLNKNRNIQTNVR